MVYSHYRRYVRREYERRRYVAIEIRRRRLDLRHGQPFERVHADEVLEFIRAGSYRFAEHGRGGRPRREGVA